MSAILPVLTVITDATGAEIGDAQEIRIGAGLTVTLVTNDGPPRILIIATPDTSGLLPFTLPVVQAPISAGNNDTTRLVFASTGSPSRVTGAAFFAANSLVAHATNFISVYLQEVTETGANHGSPIPGTVGNTKIVGEGASGDWDAGALVWDFGLGIDIAAGHSIVAKWDDSTHGSGVAMGGGEWRIT